MPIEVPEGWRRCKFSEGVSLLSGQHIEAKDYHAGPDGTPYLTGPTDFPDGIIRKTKFTHSPKVVCAPGDVLVTVKGSGTGKTTVADDAYCISRQLMAISPRSWDADFVFQLVSLWTRELNEAASGLIPGIARVDLLGRMVEVPPLPEQKKIAAILSSVDEAIQATQGVIDQTRQVKEGLLQDLLTRGIGHTRFKESPIGEIPEGWEHGRFSDFLSAKDAIKPGPFGSALTKDKYVSNGLKVYGQEQVLARDLSVGDYFITEQHHEKLKVFTVAEGDILLTLVGAGTPGKVIVVEEPFQPGIINPRLIRIRPPVGILPAFIARVFESPTLQQEIIRVGQGGAMPVLSASLVKALPLVVPPLDEQVAIVERLDKHDRAVARNRALADGLLSIKAGLLQDLLTGKVRVAV